MLKEEEIIGYHFHIYYYPNDTEQLERSKLLFEEAKERFGNDLRVVVWPHPVGPHVIPMFEIDIVGKDLVEKFFATVMAWTLTTCVGQPVLLHPVFVDNKNEVEAHSIYALWLDSSKTVPINLEKLK
ncbi:hypothetical protein ABK040_001605 [Willaertia magna]